MPPCLMPPGPMPPGPMPPGPMPPGPCISGPIPFERISSSSSRPKTICCNTSSTLKTPPDDCQSSW
eukprot:CAMPEP_0174759722 /NCGR_PEP_ID=MMETSP1094-20130205/108415_1 /TAXON_ID=156173 /ORGANISM="Chrysochromulina brevifilum, Strain UTEX LB 985" /LENGTH=65 /DNA_ID=CAMNT_0015965661 /DNA_START=576 /DNA_END=770 /DNA_ORIENTATION=-